jgi:hypothetical protein
MIEIVFSLENYNAEREQIALIADLISIAPLEMLQMQALQPILFNWTGRPMCT